MRIWGDSSLKKLGVFVLVVVAVFFFLRDRANQAPPEVITDPVYAELRVRASASGASFDQTILVKTIDQVDCKGIRESLEKVYGPDAAKAGQQWQVQSSECKTELAPRNARLFEDEPASLTYLSMARGNRLERESRIITWGISVEQSNMLCDALAKSEISRRKGAVTCIRPA